MSNSLHHRPAKRSARLRRRRTVALGVSLGVLAGAFGSSGADLRRARRRTPSADCPVDLGRPAAGPERSRSESTSERARRRRRLAPRRSRWRVRSRHQGRRGEFPDRPWTAADRRGRCRDARCPHARGGACRDRRPWRFGARGAGRCGQGTPAGVDGGGRFRAGRTRRGVRRGDRESGEELPALERSRAHGDRERRNDGETDLDGTSRARHRGAGRHRRRPEPIGRAEDRRAGHARQVAATGIDQQRDQHSWRSRRLVRCRHEGRPHRVPGRQRAHRVGHASTRRRPPNSVWAPPQPLRPHRRRPAIRTSG